MGELMQAELLLTTSYRKVRRQWASPLSYLKMPCCSGQLTQFVVASFEWLPVVDRRCLTSTSWTAPKKTNFASLFLGVRTFETNNFRKAGFILVGSANPQARLLPAGVQKQGRNRTLTRTHHQVCEHYLFSLPSVWLFETAPLLEMDSLWSWPLQAHNLHHKVLMLSYVNNNRLKKWPSILRHFYALTNLTLLELKTNSCTF